MKKKPILSFWEVWNMSFGFLGIQFGFALQGGFMSRIFQTLGASPEDIPGLWLAAPIAGLVVQPIIGYMSDRTWSSRFGRRKPYFLLGAIFASIALVYMPHSPYLWVAAAVHKPRKSPYIFVDLQQKWYQKPSLIYRSHSTL